jgi:hypothetical protein
MTAFIDALHILHRSSGLLPEECPVGRQVNALATWATGRDLSQRVKDIEEAHGVLCTTSETACLSCPKAPEVLHTCLATRQLDVPYDIIHATWSYLGRYGKPSFDSLPKKCDIVNMVLNQKDLSHKTGILTPVMKTHCLDLAHCTSCEFGTEIFEDILLRAVDSGWVEIKHVLEAHKYTL